MVAALNQLLWSLIGLLLTIGGTFIQVYITSSPWNWNHNGIQTLSLGVTYQIGAVLLVGCLGGKNAGALSQIAYLVLGLTWFPVFTVFTQGGGIEYLKQPHFGYLLGFIPGAWVCGFLAFQASPKLESLAFSCLCGLLTIHLTGLGYLILSHTFNWAGSQALPLLQATLKYSFYPLPGQLAVVCAVTVLAYGLRHLMFY
jgi:biotin transport system substrate-specific component